MSYPPQPPPYQPGPEQPGSGHRYTAPGWPPPPQPAKRGGPGRIVLFVVLAIVGLFCAFAGLGALVDDDDPKATPTAGTAVAAATTEAATAEPKASDFTITAKVTEKTCYGEAGCSVTWTPVVKYSGPAILGDDVWQVKWEASGVESGTTEGTALVGSTGPAKQRERHARTAKKGSEITVKVTGVERGI